MNYYFLAAGSLLLVIGLVHSALGEILIFNRLRTEGWIPTDGGSALRERQVRILWANWHLVTVLGGLIGVALIWLARRPVDNPVMQVIVSAIVPTLLAGSALVLVGTKGRHPGWIGLLAVALLAIGGMRG